MKFYIGVYSKNQVLMAKTNFMISYSILKHRKTPMVENESDWLMDSSGFSELHKNGKYTFTIEDYKKSIILQKPTHFVNMDWMCEEMALKQTGKTIMEHQVLTNENHSVLMDWAKSNNYGFMGVIQGWDVSEYLQHVDTLKENGLITDYMGIGSICRRHSDFRILRIIRAVRDNLPRWVRLHAFGVKTNILKNGFPKELIHSFDSMAWSYTNRMKKPLNGFCWINHAICNYKVKNCANCPIGMMGWRGRIENLMDGSKTQCFLDGLM